MDYGVRILVIVLVLVVIPTRGQIEGGSGCDALFPIDGENGRMGYVDNKGAVVVKPQFSSALKFNDGVGVVWITDEETGYVDLQGKLMRLPGINIIGGKFSNGLAAAGYQNKIGYIDTAGKMIFQIFDRSENHVYSFSEGLVPVYKNKEFYFYDTSGKVAISRGFEGTAGSKGFIGGMATVLVEEGWAVIDRKGNYVAPPRKDGYSAPSEGLVSFSEDGTTIYLDKSGNTFLKVPYRRAGNFSEGLASFLENEKWGYIDKTGKVIIKPSFDSADEFSEGLAAVGVRDKVGFVSSRGEFVIPPQFDLIIDSFKCGVAKAKKGKDTGYIDRNGSWLWKIAK